jgi:DNA-binding transcriptional regulator YdaS (Cro superfamily)
MELKTWLSRKNKEDASFTHQYLADKLGWHFTQLSRIVNYHVVPDAATALAIERATKGEVKGWDLQMLALKNKRSKEKKK